MTTARSTAVRVNMLGLGAGQVVTDLPPEALAEGQSRIFPTNSPYAQNLRLLDGVAVTRPGYVSLGSNPNGNRITGLFQALLTNDIQYLIRCTRSSVHTIRDTTDAWLDHSSDFTFTGGDTDWWSFTMGIRTGTVDIPPNQAFICDGVEGEIYRWPGTGDWMPLQGTGRPRGVRAMATFLNRLWAGNGIDIVTGSRAPNRVQWSKNGDPDDWQTIGSGATDLLDDPHPVINMSVIAGRLIVWKGDAYGGAIYVGTPTGNPSAPVRWDGLNPGTRNGLLIPRSLVLTSPNLAAFVGHDGFYLFDGVRTLTPIMTSVTRDLLSRLNYAARETAHAWYKPEKSELHFALPVDGSTTPSETWVWNLKERRTYGPYTYGAGSIRPTTSVLYSSLSDHLEWSEASGTWQTPVTPAAGTEWRNANGTDTKVVVALGAGIGTIFIDDETATDDNGTAISIEYRTPAITADQRIKRVAQGQETLLTSEDVLTLLDYTIRYRDDGAWNPTVQVSFDNGSSWTTISDGSSVGTGSGRVLTKSYFANTSNVNFLTRITSTGTVALYGITQEYEHMGSDRSS